MINVKRYLAYRPTCLVLILVHHIHFKTYVVMCACYLFRKGYMAYQTLGQILCLTYQVLQNQYEWRKNNSKQVQRIQTKSALLQYKNLSYSHFCNKQKIIHSAMNNNSGNSYFDAPNQSNRYGLVTRSLGRPIPSFSTRNAWSRSDLVSRIMVKNVLASFNSVLMFSCSLFRQLIGVCSMILLHPLTQEQLHQTCTYSSVHHHI